MIGLSVALHALFLYGIRVKTSALSEPPALAMKATIAPRPNAVPAPAAETPAQVSAKKTPVPPKKMAKAGAKTPKPVQAIPAKPMAGHPLPEPLSEASTPEAAPNLPPSPTPEKTIAAREAPNLPAEAPPAIANLQQRAGAKVRTPTPIENPTMPADGTVAMERKVVEEPQPEPAPIPAIATAPHPLAPIGQDGPPRVETLPAIVNQPTPTPIAKAPPAAEQPPIPETVAVTPAAKEPGNVAVIAPQSMPPTSANIDPKVLPLPASGEAQYKLRMGIVSGELTLSWKFADGHYRLDSVAQGSGIFAIAGKFVQASEGDVATSGLRPSTFSMERRGKKDSAAFNWADNSVRFTGKSGERTEAATPGTQDMLSLLFQLAFAPPLGADLTVIVTNGRKLERYAFERAGNEVISLEGGKFNTLKIIKQRKGDDDGMEVWLALEHHYLPVKIRVTDKKGSVIEQSLTAMKVVSVN
jgi:Protein of unknown function (DUF3108)